MYRFIVLLGSYLFSFKNYLFTLIAKPINPYDIPIVINNRNRLTFLLQLISFLDNAGYKNIIILDNLSTYPSLLEFYKTTKYKVILLNENMGYTALEKISLYKKIRKNYFVYTDSDVVPITECPSDFLCYFKTILKKHSFVQKVGFSLKIDDLPDYFKDKSKVIQWEKNFFLNRIENDLFLAPIDTTFALHRPYAFISTRGIFKMIRTGYPYVARHMPWYNDSSNLSEEELFYVNSVEIGTQWSKGLPISKDKFFVRLFKEKRKKINSILNKL
jgi:hypothetical protein